LPYDPEPRYDQVLNLAHSPDPGGHSQEGFSAGLGTNLSVFVFAVQRLMGGRPPVASGQGLEGGRKSKGKRQKSKIKAHRGGAEGGGLGKGFHAEAAEGAEETVSRGGRGGRGEASNWRRRWALGL